MTFETTPTKFVDAAGTCFADRRAAPRCWWSGNVVGIEGVLERTRNREHFLLDLVPAALIVTCAIVSSSVIARADPLGGAAKPWPAPIGHAQPRANDFSPSSPAEQAVQDELSAFDAQQKKLDELLDKKLNVCRC